MRTFEALWSTINDNYVYEDFEGTDWNSVHDEKLQQLDTQLTSEEFTAVMRFWLSKGRQLAPRWGLAKLNEDLAFAMQQMASESKLDALVLDLRVVTAGNTWPAAAMLPLFTDGTIGEFYNRSGSAAAEVDLEGATPFFLPDGSRVIIATTSFRTSDGREIGLLGVESDIQVPDDWDEVTLNDDNVLRSALEALLPSE